MNKCEQCGKPIEGFHVDLAYDTGDKLFCDPKCADLYTKPKEQTGERIKELESLCRDLVTTLEGAVFWLKGAGYSVEDYLFMASKAKEVLGDE